MTETEFLEEELHFNPRSPCGERRRLLYRWERIQRISIHAPLAGSDVAFFDRQQVAIISIHAPLAGSDASGKHLPLIMSNFNPRSPCGERPSPNTAAFLACRFQSTLPLRGATGGNREQKYQRKISIHAPLAGSDSPWGVKFCRYRDFNPRSPCGERQKLLDKPL